MGWVGVGFLGSSLPVAIAACGNQSSPTASSDAPADTPAATPAAEYEVAGTITQFNDSDAILYESSTLGPVLIARNPVTPDLLYAVNPKCTHAGCNVEWKASQELFVCPCHDSQFTGGGSVSQGPATESLPIFEVKVEGEEIMVRSATT